MGHWAPEHTLPPAGSTLKVNPEERLSITELVNQLQEIAAARDVNPKSPITEVRIAFRVLLGRPGSHEAQAAVKGGLPCREVPPHPRGHLTGGRQHRQETLLRPRAQGQEVEGEA